MLHYATRKEAAQLIIESATTNKQREFILAVDEDECTALHLAASEGRIDVVEYLCSISPADGEMVLKENKKGRTALHCAKELETAQLLVESVEPDKQRGFILAVDEDECTALHLAASEGRIDVAEYLCSIPLPDSELMLKRDKKGGTALHCAMSKEIAQLLVQSVEPDKQRDFILAVDEDHCTALHTATVPGRTDVVEYLCSIPLSNSELIRKNNKCGRTALHYAKTKEIAQLLVNSVEPDRQRDILLTSDEDGNTTLHLAAIQDRPDVIEYLCSFPLFGYELAQAQNCMGETPLHVLASAYAGRVMLASLHVNIAKELELIQKESTLGENVVMSLIKYGRADSLQFILDYVEGNYELDSPTWSSILRKTNFRKQNMLHLATISPAMPELNAVLQDYWHYGDLGTMILSRDMHDNTPLLYVAAKYCTEMFADFILHLPLQKRHSIIKLRNRKEVDCNLIMCQKTFSEAFYLQRVLCDSFAQTYFSRFEKLTYFLSPDLHHRLQHPEQYYKPNEVIFKVLKYALNDYSLLDSGYTISHALFSSALATQQANVGAAAWKHQKKISDVTLWSSEKSQPDSVYMYIDYDEVEESKQNNIQRLLNDMDLHDFHGKPKIAVVGCTGSEKLNLVVPGPDYLVLTVEYTTRVSRSELLDINKCESTDHFIEELRNNTDVERVCVNSSLGKRYLREKAPTDVEPGDADVRLSDAETEPTCDAQTEVGSDDTRLPITGNNRGKALIICNQLQPDMTNMAEVDTSWAMVTAKRRQISLEAARAVFSSHFGLQVVVKRDLTADEMMTAISEFSKSEGHGSVVVLAIISYGFEGKISGADSNSECSVQEVVDCLYGGNTDNIPKLLFMSFCRGGIPAKYNRAPHSFECSRQFPWPENEIGMTLQPVRQLLPVRIRDMKWKKMDFHSLNLPVDCYICFSTLPDNKSKNLMFEALANHLADISREATADAKQECATTPVPDLAESGIGSCATSVIVNSSSDGSSDTSSEHDTSCSYTGSITSELSSDVDDCASLGLSVLSSGYVSMTSSANSVAGSESGIWSKDSDVDSITSDSKYEKTDKTKCKPAARVELVALFTDIAGIVREKSRATQYMNICYTQNKNSKPVFLDVLPR